MTTPNLGLFIPSSTEIARLWADETSAEDWLRANNTIIEDAIGNLALSSYNPSIWSSNIGGTEIDLGSGSSVSGMYRTLPHDMVIGWAVIELGTNPFDNVGDVFLNFTLPTSVSTFLETSTTLGWGAALGEAVFRDDSSQSNSQTGVVQLVNRDGSGTGVGMIRVSLEQNSFGTFAATNGTPFSFDETDRLAYNFIYQAA